MTTANADSEPREPHAVHCQRMLDHAARMIEDGDCIQASEKMWGAFAHRIEAIAAQRGWECTAHDDLRVITEHIARRTGNAGILDLYHHANNAHQNFYKDRLNLSDIIGLLERIQALLPLLDPDDPNLPPADDPPTNNRYRERHNLDELPPISGASANGRCSGSQNCAAPPISSGNAPCSKPQSNPWTETPPPPTERPPHRR